MIDKIVTSIHTKNGQYIISFILGVGIASLFRKICRDRNCLVFKAPDFDEVTKNVYTYGEKCYSFKKNSVTCGNVEREISI
jgi:hypothetical protein